MKTRNENQRIILCETFDEFDVFGMMTSTVDVLETRLRPSSSSANGDTCPSLDVESGCLVVKHMIH